MDSRPLLTVFFDQRREQLWRNLHFTHYEELDAISEVGAVLWIVHSTDLAAELGSSNHPWRTPDQFISHVRKQHFRSAILFISGDPDAWKPLQPFDRPDPTDHWLCVYEGGVPDDEASFQSFADRLFGMLREWTSFTSAPSWDLLTDSWVRKAYEHVLGLQLLVRQPERFRELAARGLHDELFSPTRISRQCDTLGITQEERQLLESVQEVARDGASDASEATLNAAMTSLDALMSKDRESARTQMKREVARILHNLFTNGFGGILQPGWKDQRLTSVDIVLLALSGNAEARRDVAEAIGYWHHEVAHALGRLFRSVSRDYGYVTSGAWDNAMEAVKAADLTIQQLFADDSLADSQLVLQRAQAFWVACDVVGQFLATIRSQSSTYFVRWQPPSAAKQAGSRG